MRFPRFALTLLAGLVLAILATPVSAGPIFISPTPYMSAADSPFNGGSFSYFFLEDFEDAQLNTPGAAASGGNVIGSDVYVDSVEGGSAGHSWYSGFVFESFTFTFDPVALGSLPTHVGIVWTDIGWNAARSYYDEVVFEAFDAIGASLGTIGPYLMGDGMDTGQKEEDRFFGVIYDAGISKIMLKTQNADWEVDHLQYGAEAVTATAVPEPSTLVLLGSGALALYRSRKKK